MKSEKKRSLLTMRNMSVIILLLIMIISGMGLLCEKLQSVRQFEIEESLSALADNRGTENTEAEKISSVAETSAACHPYHSPVDFPALKSQNPDTIGWIRVPGTRIDYPIVQTSDNEKYLHTDFEGTDNIYGTIYLDCDSKSDFSGRNNPIYGHHMKDGSMFRDVVKFKDKKFFDEHRYFEIYTPERTIHLKTVACYYTKADGIVRKTKFENQESFDRWLDERFAPCSFADLPDKDEPVKSVFVLVTCSYEIKDARTLLFAVEDGDSR